MGVGDSNYVYHTNDTTYVINNLSDNNIYHWSVSAIDLNGGITINNDGPSMFIINQVNDSPSVVTLMAPIEGAHNQC